ncbi:pyridoxal-phosphate dependent enzyme [Corynebacterium halotolerans]|uniref:pyridoxal-phosphate dependent enzyme n=1 Tax=Corynebacterium halotolerans TaxID=225326 RepID=UPI003CEBE9D9
MSHVETDPDTGIRSTIGNTPLIRLDRLLPRPDVTVWAKLEYFNPGGSAKDRTAKALIDAARRTGELRPGMSIIESSSGNLGMALAREASLGGWPFHCVVDPRVNQQAVATMTALGAKVHHVTEPDPVTGDWLQARRSRVAELLQEIPGSLSLDQYSNRAAFGAHADGTMTEVVEQLGHAPDLLLVAMSTTGTIGGCLRHLRRIGAATTTVGVDAEGSVLFGGCRGHRSLPGFGAGVLPELATESRPDAVDRVSDIDSVTGARLLARREGILPGASGGAVVTAALARAADLPVGSEMVLILHDAGGAYLDTVYNDEWTRQTLGIDGAELEERISTFP